MESTWGVMKRDNGLAGNQLRVSNTMGGYLSRGVN